MWICHHCGTENDTLFCAGCGARRPGGGAPRQRKRGGRLCPHCGAQIGSGLTVCMDCGRRLPEAVPRRAETRAQDDEERPEAAPRRASAGYIVGSV
ncbi:MAG: hypothetical protein Q4C13_07905, partial [Clostridia bacterium]|nr:hypothetical protein [Clostridia bacterium]